MSERQPLEAPAVVEATRAVSWRAITALLLALVMASSFGVIYTAHQSRELFRTLEKSRQRENQIQIEWRQLLLERSTLSSHARIEAMAGSELRMHPLDDELRTVVIE